MRFDLRVPGKGPQQIAEQFRAAIDMAAWADQHAPCTIGLSEHHGAADGYMSSPLVLASAMAAVTSSCPILVAAALLPMYEPVRLAEDMIALDHISCGRVSYVLGIGYRPQEYALYGLDYSKRGAIADDKLARLLELLRQASTEQGEPRVTPAPFTRDRQFLMWGGGSKAAARRAGRNGLAFYAQANFPGLREAYESAARGAGYDPGVCALPDPEMPNVVFVHGDPDAGWQELGPYLLHDAMTYASWNAAAGRPTVSLSREESIEGMRAENGAYRVLGIEDAAALIQKWGRLPLHPLCGGCPPDLAWPYLRRAVDEVLARVPAAS